MIKVLGDGGYSGENFVTSVKKLLGPKCEVEIAKRATSICRYPEKVGCRTLLLVARKMPSLMEKL